LKEPSERTCWEAAKILGAIGDPAAADALAELLDHENHDIRWVAAESLIAIGREGLKQVLMLLLSKADSVAVQKGAHHVVSRFAREQPDESLNSLMASFDSFEPAVAIPYAAFRALHNLPHQLTT
jgi:HEAT repeat protein